MNCREYGPFDGVLPSWLYLRYQFSLFIGLTADPSPPPGEGEYLKLFLMKMSLAFYESNLARAGVIKLFTTVIYEWAGLVRVVVPGIPFQLRPYLQKLD